MKFKDPNNNTSLKRPFWTYIIFFVAALLFTACAGLIDRQAIGPDGSWVGLATINQAFHNMFGYCDWLYIVTEYAGFVPVLGACFFTALGFIQLINRKSFAKIDSSLKLLGLFYILVGVVYFGFEKLCLNCRPILMNGELEASYPSSHTFLTIALCGSTVLVNCLCYEKAGWTRIMNTIAIIFLIFVPLGRLFSGVHWLSDIIGGYLIGGTLIALLNFSLQSCIKLNNKKNALD